MGNDKQGSRPGKRRDLETDALVVVDLDRKPITLRSSCWKFGGLLCLLCLYFYYLLREWRFTVRIDGSKAPCPQFDRALLDSSFSSLLLSLLLLQTASMDFLFITSWTNERKLIIAKLKALDMPYDATKTDAALKDELPCYANVVLLLLGGFFGRILDLRGEEPGVPWAYVIAMPALRFLGESGILYAAVLVLEVWRLRFGFIWQTWSNSPRANYCCCESRT